MAVTLFLAYAREDEAFANRLESFLAQLEQNSRMRFYKHDIDQMESEASMHLGEASVVLLLISPDFLNSDYVYSNEIARAIELHKQGVIDVFPIIFRPVYWGRTPFAQFQVIPKSATPITLWEKQEVAFEEVVATIEHTIKEYAIRESLRTRLTSGSGKEFYMGTQLSGDNFGQFLHNAAHKALQTLGRANIIIAGSPRVGKSTLINAVFQGNFATTGIGRPVTTSTREYTKEGIPLSLFDTQGIEKDRLDAMLADLEEFLREKQSSQDHNQHIHIAWLCIVEASHRVEEADIAFVQMLSKYTSVIVVITQAINDNGFRRKAIELLPEAKNVVRVLARDMPMGDEGYIAKAKGLDDLVNLTMEVILNAHQDALVRALNIQIQAALDLKRQRARLAVRAAAATAAAVGAVPIPMADAALIVPIQITMLATISAIWGLSVSEASLSTIVSGLTTSSIATLDGRTLIGTLLKFIPGIGTVTGGLISAAAAATITTGFGEAYIATLYALTKSHPDRMPTTEEIKEEFQRLLGKKA